MVSKHIKALAICPVCKGERLARVSDPKFGSRLCYLCSRHKLPRRVIGNGYGYVQLKLSPEDPFYSMVSQRGYVLEHRLIIAKHLKRCLLPWEVVHHINGVKDDNRLENLLLISVKSIHVATARMEQELKRQFKQLLYLREENKQLKRKLDECS